MSTHSYSGIMQENELDHLKYINSMKGKIVKSESTILNYKKIEGNGNQIQY